ncbi:hypothetical protein XHV734_0781 [Xanthomonas hortorum pv. vitians]|nr:hypothetical protein XHV734_0781 [Xanthomonas hortorum pv. vitians]
MAAGRANRLAVRQLPRWGAQPRRRGGVGVVHHGGHGVALRHRRTPRCMGRAGVWRVGGQRLRSRSAVVPGDLAAVCGGVRLHQLFGDWPLRERVGVQALVMRRLPAAADVQPTVFERC